MARLFETGGETGAAEWNGVTNRVLYSTTVKRSGSYSLQMNSIGTASNNCGYFRHVFAENKVELFGRFALYLNNDASSERDILLVRFHDSANATQFRIQYDLGTACLGWYNGANVLLALGNVLIPATTWVVVEFRVVVDDATGSLTIKINGTTDAVFSGDTDYTNMGDVRSIYFMGIGLTGNVSGGHSEYFDDIAINDTSGAYQNSWIGLGGVYYLPPTADGYQNDWKPSAGFDNYAMVDEVPPNTTDYVQALDAADLDLYELANTPEYVDRINLLRVLYRAAVTTSGSNDLRDVIRVGIVNHEGDTFTVVPLIPSFTLYTGPAYYLNPETAAAWEVVEVDALEAGFEIV